LLETLQGRISLSVIVVILIFLVGYPSNLRIHFEASAELGSASNNKLASESVARFSLQVVDSNKTLASNQTITAVNSTETLSITCDPPVLKLYQGKPSEVVCNIHNTSDANMDLILQIIGLEETGVKYTINGHTNNGPIYLGANSSKNFYLSMIDSNIQKRELGKSYDYILRVNCMISIECY
jgi:hypothetical protein